jgi:hypothetical protein
LKCGPILQANEDATLQIRFRVEYTAFTVLEDQLQVEVI